MVANVVLPDLNESLLAPHADTARPTAIARHTAGRIPGIGLGVLFDAGRARTGEDVGDKSEVREDEACNGPTELRSVIPLGPPESQVGWDDSDSKHSKIAVQGSTPVWHPDERRVSLLAATVATAGGREGSVAARACERVEKFDLVR